MEIQCAVVFLQLCTLRSCWGAAWPLCSFHLSLLHKAPKRPKISVEHQKLHSTPTLCLVEGQIVHPCHVLLLNSEEEERRQPFFSFVLQARRPFLSKLFGTLVKMSSSLGVRARTLDFTDFATRDARTGTRFTAGPPVCCDEPV